MVVSVRPFFREYILSRAMCHSSPNGFWMNPTDFFVISEDLLQVCDAMGGK